jgi:DNA-binding winged helix-turn-helix (wHTH) protein/TolB-like protein/Tfp pilus assembly protein PilF
MATVERYAFGEFVLERSQQRVLRCDGSELVLSPRLFNTLLLFVEKAGTLLDKDTLLQALWPGLVVEENNLSQVVSGLRRALGDDTQGSRFIQTVPRRGFRFVAPVRPLPEIGAATVVQPVAPAAASTPAIAASGTAGGAAPAPAASATQHIAVPDRRRWLHFALAAGAAAGLASAGGWAWRSRSTQEMTLRRTTLAVLPFKPLLAERRDELLEIGMADSLTARLSTMPGLVVRSSSSVLGYAGMRQDPLRAARELDADWIVDGTWQRSGDQVRVTARLLRASDGSAAWSGSFNARFSGVFDLQDQISAQVAQELGPLLRGDTVANAHQGEPGGTRSTEAYQLYLAAAWRAQDMRSESAGKAVQLLEQALAIDPNYALAWALLAWAHRRKLFRNDARPAEVFAAADAATQRALAIAPELAQARAALGFSLQMYAFDWSGAEREFGHALVANANESSAHFGKGLLLPAQGRIDEGLSHLRMARELDPMSPVIRAVEASYLLAAGRLAEARQRLDRALDIAPQHGLLQLTLGMLLMQQGQAEQGIAALRRAVELHDAASRPKAVLGMYLARAGQNDEARAILVQLQGVGQTRFMPPTSLATLHAALGEPMLALDELERAYLARDTRLLYATGDPSWVTLHQQPRYLSLMTKLRLDPSGPGLAPV